MWITQQLQNTDNDLDHQPSVDRDIDLIPEEELSDYATREQAPCVVDLDATVAYDLDDTLSSGVNEIPQDSRRSTRTSKPPSWMKSGDFVLGKKK